ncbi:hypothetical protein HOLleu_15477 [Holothuria leucospilota]|uniref:Uncharacterized protein n=1 Tax=Holothuria leucospilota TaxID=206669 RepID=A0A9Q1CAH7_HOLLE|nr:hypothetical protein HOLleu_15477 [Holothuria leucospilota]
MVAIPVVPIITGVEVQQLIVNVTVAWTTEFKVIKNFVAVQRTEKTAGVEETFLRGMGI